MWRFPPLFGLLVLTVAAAWSVTLACADASARAGAIAVAMTQVPGNAEYIALAAVQSEEPRPLLERIVQLTPRVSAPRIRLALIAEQRGDTVLAERTLLDAFAVDHQFETRWTLANFYLRQGRAADFWTWIRSALAVSYGDRRAAFDLCLQMSSDPQEILARAIPDREDVAADYLVYLVDHQRPDALALAAKRVHNPDLLLPAVDILLDSGRYAEAVDVWRFAGRGGPSGITGPNFEAPQSGRGFDWRRIRSEGVRHPFPGRIELTGKQAESVELLRQIVGGLEPGTRYRLQWKASMDVPGVEWRVDGQPATEFLATAPSAVVSLWYDRPIGEMRAEASFDLSGIVLLPLY